MEEGQYNNPHNLDTQNWLCPDKLHATCMRTVHGMHTEGLHTQNGLCMPWTVHIALSFSERNVRCVCRMVLCAEWLLCVNVISSTTACCGSRG